MNRRTSLGLLAAALVAPPAFAQFTGPSAQGQQTSVAEALDIRLGRYVTLEGNIVSHLRADYYMFRDASGEIRVEIPSETFGGREVGPDTLVRIMGEIDQTMAGRYVWVKTLDLV